MRKNIQILFRSSLDLEDEKQAAISVFGEDVVESRMDVKRDSLVIGRYSVLPFYRELELDLSRLGSVLINSFRDHNYISEMDYIGDLGDLTPETWFCWANIPEGSYVVKGLTNSRKHQWNRQMFAETKSDVSRIVNNLLDDALIRSQGVVVRKYIPLRKFAEGINGLPITNEWRCFFLRDKMIGSSYYWADHEECAPSSIIPSNGRLIAQKAADILCERLAFFVVDVAETEDGDWIVIEVNDGQMSGLSLINPISFYSELKNCF